MFKSYQPGKAAVLANKAHSLSHTKWMCKYHIVFTPKYRRKLIYSQYRDSLGEIFRNLCRYKGVEIIEGHLMPDHVHMLVSIPPKISVSSFMGYLKGKSALMMFDKHANDSEVHQGAGGPRHRAGQVERQGVRGPVQEEVGEPL